jgi:hypothetical protein
LAVVAPPWGFALTQGNLQPLALSRSKLLKKHSWSASSRGTRIIKKMIKKNHQTIIKKIIKKPLPKLPGWFPQNKINRSLLVRGERVYLFNKKKLSRILG